MGRRILELASEADGVEVGGAFEISDLAGHELILGRRERVRVGADAAAELNASDVLIDFTAPEATVENIRLATELKKPAVVGTTGLGPDEVAVLGDCAAVIPLVWAPNMSVGMNLLFKLVREVAGVLGLDYNVEVVEAHHNQKKDSPSGTAVRLAERAAEGLGLDYQTDAVHGREGQVGARPPGEIGMHAVRGGDVAGEHTVYFLGSGERLELTHRASSRDTFAQGALRAARFAVAAGPGLYDMQDVLGLK
jgi:4-hydroxy-tetrahydrodipicolinate reductase